VQVTVALFGAYARLLPEGSPGGKAAVELRSNTTVDALLDQLRVPEAGRRYVAVNGVVISLEHVLEDGDEVKVIVPLGGG
jgi:sulfur carrier protein ThiS